jgi:hypothetical protein
VPAISTTIGRFFEERLLAAIPGLEDFRDADDAPDFRLGNVWIEAKVAFDATDYGILPKTYQFGMHKLFSPMVYACGYHDFVGAMAALVPMKEEDRLSHLHENARINRMFLISSSIIDRIWRRDAKTNGKETQVYCPIAPNDFRHIINDDQVRRGRRRTSARNYYGMKSFRYQDAQPIGYILNHRDFRLLEDRLSTIDHKPLMERKTGDTGI